MPQKLVPIAIGHNNDFEVHCRETLVFKDSSVRSCGVVVSTALSKQKFAGSIANDQLFFQPSVHARRQPLPVWPPALINIPLSFNL